MKDIQTLLISISGLLALLFTIGRYTLKSFKIAKKIDDLIATVSLNSQAIERIENITKQNKEAHCNMIGNILYTRCNECLVNQDISIADYCYLLTFYEEYLKLGGNGTITRLWNETLRLAKTKGIDTSSCNIKGA